MATLIEKVQRQALNTFTFKFGNTHFEENLKKLKMLASELKSADVKLDKSLLSSPKYRVGWHSNRSAPVTYIEIFENSYITLGIFILRNGARLPLHDHPLMYGVLKVIQGNVHIRSFTPLCSTSVIEDKHLDNDLNTNKKFYDNIIESCEFDSPPSGIFRENSFFAFKEPDLFLNEEDDACVLYPKQGNIHEITAVNGPAAFVDILAPPYNTDLPDIGPRPCRYFKEISDNEDNKVITLVRVPSPDDYWSDSAPYEGPAVLN